MYELLCIGNKFEKKSYKNIYIYIYIFEYSCINEYNYICIHVCMYIYIYIYNSLCYIFRSSLVLFIDIHM